MYFIGFLVIDELRSNHICEVSQLEISLAWGFRDTGSGVSRTFFITAVASSTAATH
jgi:hypothetical protein